MKNHSAYKAKLFSKQWWLRWLLLCYFSVVFGAVVGTVWAFSRTDEQFIFNATDSVEGYVFMLGGSGTPYRGALIAFQPPKNDFYRHIKFIKYVAGIPGDRVTRRGREFFINDKFIGVAKEFSKKGAPLKASEPGVIPHGKVFVWTPHPDSFDSRYAQISLLDQKNIIGFVSRFF